jgi:antitoxin (DNA-binding transcriptional repressor) of toxin-antitoxin stability system
LEAAMATIPHRQLRSETSKILMRVKNGEIIDVTVDGEVAATLVPPSSPVFERLLRSGAIRPSTATGPVNFMLLDRTKSDVSSDGLLRELRGD